MPICENPDCRKEFPRDPIHKDKKYCSKSCFQAYAKKHYSRPDSVRALRRLGAYTKPKPRPRAPKDKCGYGCDVMLKSPNFDSIKACPCWGCSLLLNCDAEKCEQLLKWLESEGS